ncbi:MAG: hypothetical protein IJQ81_10115, partial [Oscillibacter sp.]|nr:hypothetical protein [Oscillibacter sp.]
MPSIKIRSASALQTAMDCHDSFFLSGYSGWKYHTISEKTVDKTNGGVVYSNRVIKMKKYIITKEEYEAVKAAQKK